MNFEGLTWRLSGGVLCCGCHGCGGVSECLSEAAMVVNCVKLAESAVNAVDRNIRKLPIVCDIYSRNRNGEIVNIVCVTEHGN